MSSEENDFERDRRERIRRNNDLLSSLGVQAAADKVAETRQVQEEKEVRRKSKRCGTKPKNLPVRRSSRSTAEKTRLRLKGMAEKGSRELKSSESSSGSEGSGESFGSSSARRVSSDEEHGSEEEVSEEVGGDDSDGVVDGGEAPCARRIGRRRGRKINFGKGWPSSADSHEVRKGYEFFARQSGLMTLESVESVCSDLSMALGEDQVAAMMEFATNMTGSHPQCLTFEEFKGLVSCLMYR